MGLRVCEVGGSFWHEVRPFFFRSLWPFHPRVHGTVPIPARARLGACQYPVPAGSPHNSNLNLFVFPDAAAYSLARLARKPRKQVRLAGKEFVIRQITDPREFKRQARLVYQDFYNRTRYRTGRERRAEEGFSTWTDALYRIPGVLVLGGYRSGELGGVSLSFRVGDVVNYASFFCDDRSLRLHLSDLMLHTIRESAGTTAGVTRVFAGSYKGVQGLDEFKRFRGATLLRQPAWLEVNPLAGAFLRWFLPRQHAQLLGALGSPQL